MESYAKSSIEMLPILVTELASKGFSLIANALLVKGKDWIENKTGLDLNKAVMSEEGLVAIRQAELNHEVELMRLMAEDNKLRAAMDEMYLKDTQSAREMQVAALSTEDVFSRRFIYHLTTFWSIMAVLYVAAITFFQIPEENIRFADTILGFLLGTIISQIMAFFYGSSKSSQTKDAVISEVVGRATRNKHDSR